jgi:hypothetical protein
MKVPRILKDWTKKFHWWHWPYLRIRQAPVVPPKRVVDLLLKTRRPVYWSNPPWNCEWRMFYRTELKTGKVITRLLPPSYKPCKDWLYKD